MFIEHQSDRNMTGTGQKDPRVSDMIDLQQALVADHIAGLEREGAALRAERARDEAQTREIAPAATEPVPLPIVPTASPRIRVGRWLVAIGTAIAGTAEPVARAIVEDCAADAGDTLSHAA
jgi:hypothetical protein